MATKKEKAAVNDPAKEAKRLARKEALKNRPEGQRPNSKQIDVIVLGEGKEVRNYGYPVKNKEGHQGVLVTSVVVVDGNVESTSVAFVPGNLTVKAKKGHGTITTPKTKKGGKDVEEEEDDTEEVEETAKPSKKRKASKED